jgi:hypothetical protein
MSRLENFCAITKEGEPNGSIQFVAIGPLMAEIAKIEKMKGLPTKNLQRDVFNAICAVNRSNDVK